MGESGEKSFEERSRTLFNDSVEALDMRLRSRLTQARYAALARAAVTHRPWLDRVGSWKRAAGVAAAGLLAVALWTGSPVFHHSHLASEGQANLEDLELVAFADETSDPMDMLQDDIEFYDWANKGANTGPQA